MDPNAMAAWKLTVAPAWREVFGDPDRVLASLQSPETVIRDNRRSTLVLIRVGSTTLVGKCRRRHESRPWIRLSSVVRGGGGSRAHHVLGQLHERGLPVPEPVLSLERTRWGVVLESWHVYRWVEGRACAGADARAIADALRRLHRSGWVHRDPNVQNFLATDAGVVLIDVTSARPWRCEYARIYDVLLLDRSCPGACNAYPGFPRSRLLYRLARLQLSWIAGWRRVKKPLLRQTPRFTAPAHGGGKRPA